MSGDSGAAKRQGEMRVDLGGDDRPAERREQDPGIACLGIGRIEAGHHRLQRLDLAGPLRANAGSARR